jgi:hypothetical protein
VRHSHLENDLACSDYSKDLYKQYKVHLGAARYKLLKEGQVLVVPPKVRELMNFKSYSLLSPVVPLYKFSRKIKLDALIKALILPSEYKKEISDLDVIPGG